MNQQTFDIGKIGITPKGEWSNLVAYEYLDTVTYNGSSYLALKDVEEGIVLNNTEYWQCIASASEPEFLDKNRGGTISPIYLGDYIDTSYWVGSLVRIKNNFVTINVVPRPKLVEEHSNDGCIRIFSAKQNKELINDKVIGPVNHGNSAAYDPEKNILYVLPLLDSSSGEEVRIETIYKYSVSENMDDDSDPDYSMTLTYIGSILQWVPSSAQLYLTGLSYDPITKTLYGINAMHNKIYKIYDEENGQYELYSTINISNIETDLFDTYSEPTRPQNQDFAVYNSHFYFSTPWHNIYFGNLTEGNCEVKGCFSIAHTEIQGRFLMGELEGMEFDQNGHLYASLFNVIGAADSLVNNFVVELPVGETTPYSTKLAIASRLTNATYQLSNDTIYKFALDDYEIRSLNQLVFQNVGSMSQAATVTIPVDSSIVEEAIVRIENDICISLQGTLTLPQLYIIRGQTNITSQNNGNRLIFTISNITPAINIERTGRLGFIGNIPINISIPNITNVPDPYNFINPGYDYSFVQIRTKPISVEGYNFANGGSLLADRANFIASAQLFSQTTNINIVRDYLKLKGLTCQVFKLKASTKYSFKITANNNLPFNGFLWCSNVFNAAVQIYALQVYYQSTHYWMPIANSGNNNFTFTSSTSGLIINNNLTADANLYILGFTGDNANVTLTETT